MHNATMVGFSCQTDLPGKKEHKLKQCFHQIDLWTWLWTSFPIASSFWRARLLWAEPSHAGVGSPGLYKRCSWASQTVQASNQCFSVVFASFLNSRFVPWLVGVWKTRMLKEMQTTETLLVKFQKGAEETVGGIYVNLEVKPSVL